LVGHGRSVLSRGNARETYGWTIATAAACISRLR
jgi:hypothetical protein